MDHGRALLQEVISGRSIRPPIVVPFGLDPFGWHGERPSYRDVCAAALERCPLLPKVYPIPHPLCVGEEGARITRVIRQGADGTRVREHTLSRELPSREKPFVMTEVQTPGDSTWKTSKRWIETDEELDRFIAADFAPAEPDLEAIRNKERQAGRHGLPYVEVSDPLGTVCDMFPTETFYIGLRTDQRILRLLETTAERILSAVEIICRQAGCPFILRLIGAELAVPPFLSREDFLNLEGGFYRRIARMAQEAGIPTAFHCHGPVRDIMEDVWSMGFSLLEPLEPPPRGNVSISEALAAARGRGVVFGGVDDVLLQTGEAEQVQAAVQACLREARSVDGPFILSQSATPFFDPLQTRIRDNLMLMIEAGTEG